MECCLCKGKIHKEKITGWSEGHNAEPVVQDGRCCQDCNTEIVIPHRLIILNERLGFEPLGGGA